MPVDFGRKLNEQHPRGQVHTEEPGTFLLWGDGASSKWSNSSILGFNFFFQLCQRWSPLCCQWWRTGNLRGRNLCLWTLCFSPPWQNDRWKPQRHLGKFPETKTWKQTEMNLLLQIMEDCMVFTLAGCAITANCKSKEADKSWSYSTDLFTFFKFSQFFFPLYFKPNSCYNPTQEGGILPPIIIYFRFSN